MFRNILSIAVLMMTTSFAIGADRAVKVEDSKEKTEHVVEGKRNAEAGRNFKNRADVGAAGLDVKTKSLAEAKKGLCDADCLASAAKLADMANDPEKYKLNGIAGEKFGVVLLRIADLQKTMTTKDAIAAALKEAGISEDDFNKCEV